MSDPYGKCQTLVEKVLDLVEKVTNLTEKVTELKKSNRAERKSNRVSLTAISRKNRCSTRQLRAFYESLNPENIEICLKSLF